MGCCDEASSLIESNSLEFSTRNDQKSASERKSFNCSLKPHEFWIRARIVWGSQLRSWFEKLDSIFHNRCLQQQSYTPEAALNRANFPCSTSICFMAVLCFISKVFFSLEIFLNGVGWARIMSANHFIVKFKPNRWISTATFWRNFSHPDATPKS